MAVSFRITDPQFSKISVSMPFSAVSTGWFCIYSSRFSGLANLVGYHL